jgi:16S rRNA C1402 N4-methylase RsmH
MMSDQEMKDKIIAGLIAHAKGVIALHKTNVEVYLEKTVGIGEHSDILETIQKELDLIAQQEDRIDVLEKHFG